MALHPRSVSFLFFLFMYKHFLKRGLDFILVFCVLAVIWPILLVITVWLHFANKGAGTFFTQERPGKGGKIFKVIKFFYEGMMIYFYRVFLGIWGSLSYLLLV